MTNPDQATPASSPRKPTGGVVALGVITIVYSSMFYICCPGIGVLASPMILRWMQRIMEQQGITGFQVTRAMLLYGRIYAFLFIVVGLMLLTGGIGLLRLRQWARGLSMWTAAGMIALHIINFAITVFFLYPAGIMGKAFGRADAIGSIIGSTAGVLFQLAFPVVLIVLLNIDSIKNQFRQVDSHPS